MKVLTMVIWTFLSRTCSKDGGSSSHVISPPTQLDLLTLSRGYQRISKDTRGYQYNTCDGRSSFPGLPPATHPDLVALKRRSGTPNRHQRLPEDTRAYKLSRTFWDGGSSCPGLPPPTHPHLLVKGTDSSVPPELPLCCARPGIPVHKHKQRIWISRAERERFVTK